MIKIEKIGSKFRVYYNGVMHSGVITDDPTKYDYYKTLSLDVFEEDERTKLENILREKGIRFRKNSSLETLRLKLDEEE